MIFIKIIFNWDIFEWSEWHSDTLLFYRNGTINERTSPVRSVVEINSSNNKYKFKLIIKFTLPYFWVWFKLFNSTTFLFTLGLHTQTVTIKFNCFAFAHFSLLPHIHHSHRFLYSLFTLLLSCYVSRIFAFIPIQKTHNTIVHKIK